jgi:UDP-N-acetylmuramoyl-tripeptide--D-alanyl-D-alanine ligase
VLGRLAAEQNDEANAVGQVGHPWQRTRVRFSTSALAAATGGRLEGPDVTVDGVSIDSRGDVAGRLFVPIVAERDGHDFLADAIAAGAGAYLTTGAPSGGSAVVVEDTLLALGAIGAVARDRLPDRVVGITGSVGKTSVKDLLAAALATTFSTVASERSFNNELGVPLTLANAPGGTDAAVVEMGARGVGHIRLLCDIARPTIGVVTAIGHVHTELFGTIEEVARGKGELVEAVTGTAVLNADDERVAAMSGRTSAAVLTYGLNLAEVTATAVVLDADLCPSFHLRTPWGEGHVRLAVRGHHQVGNALAAAAAALAAGAPLDAVIGGLGQATLSPWRMDLQRTAAGALVLNDAYNANPISMAAALRSLAAIDARRRIAVLGTMAELGDVAEAEHRAVADLAASLGIEIVAVGEPRYGGELVADVDAAAEALGTLGAGDAVLVKGSRVTGLERLADLLLS